MNINKKPHLSAANSLFNEGQYKLAIEEYLDCLTYWKSFESSPKSLMAFCDARINDSKKMLKILSPEFNDDGLSFSAQSKSILLKHNPLLTKLPKVSIVIPHYNSGGLIYDALDSIANQEFHEIETIIIDDVSNDQCLTEERLAAYPSWMQIYLIIMSKNSGPSSCRNHGIQVARGRAICFLDADDYLEGKTLSSRWELINSSPVVGGVFSSMRYVDEKRNFLGSIILNNEKSFSFCDFVSNKFPCSALMFRKSTILIDQFDENLIYGEDYDCFSRIAQRGWIYHFVPDGAIGYRQHGSSITHKDVLNDLKSRMDIIERVHQRKLEWSHVSYAQNLPNATISREISNRSFPVVCIFALRGVLEKAQEISKYIDPDIISTLPVSQLAGTLRFFLTREEFIPTIDVKKFLATVDPVPLLTLFNQFFSNRHRKFVTDLIRELFDKHPNNITQYLDNVICTSMHSISWEIFMSDDDATWEGYLLIRRNDDHMPNETVDTLRDFIQKRGDVDGVFVHRISIENDRTYTDIESIAPLCPDSLELGALGKTLKPALVIHEFAARSLKRWAMKNFLKDEEANSEAWIESQCLAKVFELRLKIVGGVKNCFVVRTNSGVNDAN